MRFLPYKMMWDPIRCAKKGTRFNFEGDKVEGNFMELCIEIMYTDSDVIPASYPPPPSTGIQWSSQKMDAVVDSLLVKLF